MASAAFQPNAMQVMIANQLQDLDLTSLAIWDDLDVLSTHTHVDDIEVPAEGVVIRLDGTFSAVLNVYLSLQYGKDDQEGFTTSDSFLARVTGRVEEGRVIVDDSTVDTSSFYE